MSTPHPDPAVDPAPPRPDRTEYTEARHTTGETAGLSPPGPGWETYLARWERLQTEFVDAPGDAVGSADAILADAIEHLVADLSAQRSDLRDNVRANNESTEELRLAMQRYRTLLHRVVNT